MKLSFIVPFLSTVCISHAAVLIAPTNFTVGVGKSEIDLLGTVTGPQLGGGNQLMIEYTVTRADFSAGDSWLTLVGNGSTTILDNPSAPSSDFAATGNNFGALLRTMTATPGAHQVFGVGNAAGSGAATFTSSGSAVRILIDVTNGFTGTSAFSFLVDESPSGAFAADKTLSGTVNWGTTGNLTLHAVSQGYAHEITNFTVSVVPEISTSAFAIFSAAGMFLKRRRQS